MQIAIEVTDDMRREAEARDLPVIDYVEMLMDKGRQALQEDLAVISAIERIRALRGAVPGAKP